MAIASCSAAPYNKSMTNTKEPSRHSRDIAAKLAESAEIWQAIDDAHRLPMPDAESALARIVQIVRDEQIRAVAGSLADEVDDHPDFSIVEVSPMGSPGRDPDLYYMVTAKLWGPCGDSGEIWGGRVSTWLGLQSIDGSLTCVGWDSADQWIDTTVDRRIGTTAAVALGERILAAAEVRS